ncbi:MAG: nucleotide sugar dehydrogenase, partial [Thermoplasmata archaeon]
MARIAIVGAGYVGVVTAVAFARDGHKVICSDIDVKRVNSLRKGNSPFFEPGLEDALQEVLDGSQLTFTTDTPEAAHGADFVFLCVGTPSREDGSMDLSGLKAATRDVAQGLSKSGEESTVVVKSTVVPGTTEEVLRPIMKGAAVSRDIGLAVNPEFLREGMALKDAEKPERIVIGVYGPRTSERMRRLYSNVQCPIYETDLRAAEMIKMATNSFLAMKVAFADELANICGRLGISYDEVIKGVTLDPRINPRFLVPGVGFGGSCFPKDLRALIAIGRKMGYEARLLDAVRVQNETQYLEAV